MVSFPGVIAVILFLFASSAYAVDEIKGLLDESQLDFPSVEEKITNISEKENDIALQESACDCGPNSKGCKMENGTKVCECEYHFRQENGLCKDWCDNTWNCENGGTCVNESCQCLPGTRGGFCKIVDACQGIKGPLLCGDPDKVYCMFDAKTQKPYCHCSTLDFIYYPKTRDCIECDCGNAGSCSLIDGKKTCKCNEGAAVRKTSFWGDIVDRCVACDCGDNSDGCSFDGLYTKICNCKEGFAQEPDLYGDTCNNCSCGPHGKCYFKGWYQNCDCDEGYAAFLNKNRTKLTCEACDCGKNGVCSFEEEVKQCKCNPGYALHDGICTACQCYVESEIAPCVFTNNIQKCLCPGGYEATKFICTDINECLNGNYSCPPTSDCFNTRGTYECICKEGYTPIGPNYEIKKDGCEDINECENENLCPRNHTICINLPGNYSCTCEKGYEPVPPYFTPVFGGCQKDCDCGENSYGCSFRNGETICSCESGYIQWNGTCREQCYEWHPNECENGGTCKNSVCQCLSGTHGNRCEIVDGCEDWSDVYRKCGQKSLAYCAFNHTSGTSFCKCSLGSYVFDDYNKECKSCDCGSHGDCYFLQGEKTCNCDDGYSERPGGWYGESSCEPCDCGTHSTACRYISYASIECSCDSGYAERYFECKECSCGPYGDCSFDENGQKVCNCQSGYADKNGFCEVCDCGSNTECEFDDYEKKICRCRSGYGYKNGVCTQCDCFWNFIRANCTFPYGIQKCTCPEGFEEKTKNYCTDIDECKDNLSICPGNSVCLNTFGSYECNCKSGYRPHSDNLETKRYGCTDIDECEEINECPFRDTSKCINTQGSFYCLCKPGYHTKSASTSIELKGCLEDQTGWRIGYIILTVVFFFVSTGLLFAICKRRFSS